MIVWNSSELKDDYMAMHVRMGSDVGDTRKNSEENINRFVRCADILHSRLNESNSREELFDYEDKFQTRSK